MPAEKLFLLLCYNEGRYATRLLQLDLVTLQATSHQTLFELLRSSYRSMRGRWLSRLSLCTLIWIKFVHFEMYRSELVDVRKTDDIPPPGHVDYRYAPTPPDVMPPVGDRHMMHLFHHPECAESDSICISRFPKKLKEKLNLPNEGSQSWLGTAVCRGLGYSKDLDHCVYCIRARKFASCGYVDRVWKEYVGFFCSYGVYGDDGDSDHRVCPGIVGMTDYMSIEELNDSILS